MSTIKMLVIDLDGTLLHTDKTVSSKTLQVLQRCQNQNIYVVIATARFWIGAEKYINMIHPDYEITTDGTMIHCKNEMSYSSGLTIQTTNKLIELIREANADAEIITAIDKKVYWNSLHISESEKLYKAEYHDYRTPLSEAACKIVAELPDKQTAEEIARKCGCKLISYRDENIYSFISPDAGKIQAIRELGDKLHIRMDEIAAFGDDENDMDMLQVCGKGIAVENALESVKKMADEICDTNDKDGVAKWIDKNVLYFN